MNLWHELAPGPEGRTPQVINVVVEIPRGSNMKYELHKPTGAIKLDRVLHASVYYPGDYGLVPQTYYDDGDPLDVLVLTNNPTFPGCIVEARPVGIFHLIDHGQHDDKILAVLERDPYFAEFHDLASLPPFYMKEVTHFFSVYKDLEGITTEAKGWEGREVAWERINYAIDLYQKKVANGEILITS